MLKTSVTEPLRIYPLSVPYSKGLLGLTFCPGKIQKNAMTGSWHRNLEADLQVIREWGAGVLISLLEWHEIEELSVQALPERSREFGLKWLNLSIPDTQAPDEYFETDFQKELPGFLGSLQKGENLVLHCKGGLGRSGTVAARFLVELGLDPAEAIAAVRQARPGAIENTRQENYILDKKWIFGHRTPAHYRGCLLGGAVGDALGAPVEFLSYDDIVEKFGSRGISEFAPVFGRKGAITDNTQMTLFTAEGLLRGYCREAAKGVLDPVFAPVTYNAYLRWLVTQGIKTEFSNWHLNDSWLLKLKELHKIRGSFNTCLIALMHEKMGTMENPHNNSKDCSGVMRTAPVGLLLESFDADKNLWPEKRYQYAFETGCELAAITHGHPTVYLAAGFLSLLIARIIRGDTLEQALRFSIEELRTRPRSQECLAAVEKATQLWEYGTGVPSAHVLEKLGRGWIAEEALSISVYCALAAEGDFKKGVCLAVNHNGDSNSTGAITGSILGALLGEGAIPQSWLNDLELRDVIEEIAEDLFVTYRYEDEWYAKYPGW
jgi:ADP-ribosylglycohydrolase/protein-tyrosine phosphatase